MVPKNNTADVSNLGYVGRKPTAKRNSDSWFTPDIYLSSVRGVLGEITLDPFSDAQANEIVKAAHYFDEDADGLSQNWNITANCKVFMNPPYSAGMVKLCTDRFIEGWLQKKPDNPAPVIINISDGLPYTGTTVDEAKQKAIKVCDDIMAINSKDGNPIIFNCHIGNGKESCGFEEFENEFLFYFFC